MKHSNHTIAVLATAYFREAHLVCRPAREATTQAPARPEQRGILPISGPTLWRWVNAGKFPAPVKLSNRVTAWRAEDVRAWMAARSNGATA